MKVNSKYLLLATIVYIYVPVLIFMFGFTKLWIAILTCTVGITFIRKMYEDFKADTIKEEIVIPWWLVGVAVLVITLICISIGFGGLFIQAGDWWKHNAVIHDLVGKKWPVYYTRYERSMLTYYLGQYLLPALIGKITHGSFDVAEASMAIWGVIGVVLVYFNLIRVSRSNTWKQQLRTLVMLFFFSGCLLLAQKLMAEIYGLNFYSDGSYHWILVKSIQIQYRSNLVMLRWVYPQVVVPWLILILFMEHWRQVRNYVLLISPVLLYGTFSIVFFAFAAVSTVIFILCSEKDIKKTAIEVFSFSNLCVFVTFGIVMLSYFIGYMQVEKPYMSRMTIGRYTWDTIPAYIIFCLFMYGIYGICIYKKYKNDLLYHVAIFALTVIPLFHMGLCNDWVMGTSMMPLFVIMILVIQYLNDKQETQEYAVRSTVLIMCLIIGAWYPIWEIRDCIRDTQWGEDNSGDGYLTLENFSDRTNEEETEDLLYNYYTYDLEGKFFYEHIAARKIGE